MQIEDGTGTGKTVKVGANNRLHVDGLIKTAEHEANHRDGNAFSVLFEATPTGAGDCFFYMKNLNDLDIIVEGVGMFLPAAEFFTVVIKDEGIPVGGGTITPTNLNAGSGNTADGTFQDGNDITGLTGGVTAYKIERLAASGQEYENFEQDIILPKNAVLTLYIETGTTALHGFLDFYFTEKTT